MSRKDAYALEETVTVQHPDGREIEIYDPRGKLRTAIDAIGNQQARELALIIVNAHKGYMPDQFESSRMLCENHMNACEEEVDWPCDEIRGLAAVLGVSLE